MTGVLIQLAIPLVLILTAAGNGRGCEADVHDGARAESSLRMLEAAHAKGAVGVVNVRFEAVRINNNASELLSYGTLVY